MLVSKWLNLNSRPCLSFQKNVLQDKLDNVNRRMQLHPANGHVPWLAGRHPEAQQQKYEDLLGRSSYLSHFCPQETKKVLVDRILRQQYCSFAVFCSNVSKWS